MEGAGPRLGMGTFDRACPQPAPELPFIMKEVPLSCLVTLTFPCLKPCITTYEQWPPRGIPVPQKLPCPGLIPSDRSRV